MQTSWFHKFIVMRFYTKKYSKELILNSDECLFGEEFSAQSKVKVESDSTLCQVMSPNNLQNRHPTHSSPPLRSYNLSSLREIVEILPHSLTIQHPAVWLNITLAKCSRKKSCFSATNWVKLTQDQWMLTTIQGYQLPLTHWQVCRKTISRSGDNQLSNSQAEVHKLAEKGAVQKVKPQLVHVASPMFIVLKIGGRWEQ